MTEEVGRFALCKGEEYFETIQGEGSLLGTPSIFVRFSGCNLHCVWKNSDGSIQPCDTPHSSISLEPPSKIPYKKLIDKIGASKINCVVITGGEPFIHKNLPILTSSVNKHITIETNGTVFDPEVNWDLISISPKLASSNFSSRENHKDTRINIPVLGKFVQKSIANNKDYQFKFVFSDPKDEEEILDIMSDVLIWLSNLEYRGNIPYINDHIYLMPQGNSVEEIDVNLRMLIPIASRNNWKVSDRLHIRLFGNKRGT